MIEEITLALKLILIISFVYFVYFKCYMIYYKKWYYAKQGFKFPPMLLPFFGNLFYFAHIAQKFKHINQSPFLMIRRTFSKADRTKCGFFMGDECMLLISDPDIVQSLFTEKNRIFEKSEFHHLMMKRMTGDSIVFSKGNEEWAKRRRSISAAFYKEKLVLMIELAKKATSEKFRLWEQDYVATHKPMNLVKEIASTYASIIMSCSFGDDIKDRKV